MNKLLAIAGAAATVLLAMAMRHFSWLRSLSLLRLCTRRRWSSMRHQSCTHRRFTRPTTVTGMATAAAVS